MSIPLRNTSNEMYSSTSCNLGIIFVLVENPIAGMPFPLTTIMSEAAGHTTGVKVIFLKIEHSRTVNANYYKLFDFYELY